MSLFQRIQNALQMQVYKRFTTERLIEQIKNNKTGAIDPILSSLKERLAHQDGTLAGIDLSSVHITKATLSSSKLNKVNFSHANLTASYFAYSDLENANFQSAILNESHFREAQLSNANLASASLQRANLARANMHNVDLSSADLTEANLWRSDLRGTNLNGAILTSANFTDCIIDESTTLPDGTSGHQHVDWSQFTGTN